MSNKSIRSYEEFEETYFPAEVERRRLESETPEEFGRRIAEETLEEYRKQVDAVINGESDGE